MVEIAAHPLPVSFPSSANLPIAIVGAGFSGTLLAINLLAQGAHVVLVERQREKLARGLAYQTHQPEHLLNVRANNMSAHADDPDHFLRWLDHAENGRETDLLSTEEHPHTLSEEQANRFVPRVLYGRYLREQLMKAMANAPARFTLKEQDAVDVEWRQDRAVLQLDSGEVVHAASLVLATGHVEPQPLPVLAHLPPDLAVSNPWSPRAIEGLRPDDHVLLVGTGLTMVDVAMSLEEAGWRGKITACSRRGLMPRVHAETGPHAPPVFPPQKHGSWLLRYLRERSRQVDWRQAVDEIRPHAQSLWRLHDADEQARFLRHLRPWWDVHRHRMAPQVAQRLAAMHQEGRLTALAGRIQTAEQTGDGVQVTLQPRGTDRLEELNVTRIITCTGPQGDIAVKPAHLMANLLGQKRARPDVHRMGLDVDRLGHVLNTAGQPQPRLFAVGPMTRGEAWETVAVPDIRRQVWQLARTLTGSHWVEGDGL
ncbi:FAD/NAD(P)-binding protein [Novosphingobium terrae]|uniref:FAD/NAD(P)-binding protein n=1 Tax=Novosphingobium terrae TaxID=2726189 RepID=UPI00197F60F2|nr:FAD/NAD(P)-binding protein [Novosphingobium terrae]